MLSRLRRMWSASAAVVVLVPAAAALLSEASSSVPAWLSAALVLAVGAGALVTVRLVDRGLLLAEPADAAAAEEELRARLALQIALLQAPVLLAVALSVVLGPGALAWTGPVVGLAGLLPLWPSARRLRRIADSWRRAGHDVLPAGDVP